MPTTNEECCNGDCANHGRAEFSGFCPSCWLESLTKSERESLKRDYVPDLPEVDPIIQPVVERVRTIYPARSRITLTTLWLWRAGLTASVVWLVIRQLYPALVTWP
jgi:hypothetical protein